MQMDEFRKYILPIIEDIQEKVTDQNSRLSKLERWQAFTQGAVAVLLVLIIPVVIRVVAELFK